MSCEYFKKLKATDCVLVDECPVADSCTGDSCIYVDDRLNTPEDRVQEKRIRVFAENSGRNN